MSLELSSFVSSTLYELPMKRGEKTFMASQTTDAEGISEIHSPQA